MTAKSAAIRALWFATLICFEPYATSTVGAGEQPTSIGSQNSYKASAVGQQINKTYKEITAQTYFTKATVFGRDDRDDPNAFLTPAQFDAYNDVGRIECPV